MENGYKIFWTDNALEELQATYDYLDNNFTENELNHLSKEIERIITLISKNPKLFPKHEFRNEIRKVVVLNLNIMYYRIKNDAVEILSFFSNRQNPLKKKL